MKLIIASLVVFSIVILFLFALFPSDISVTRIVEIRCSKEKLAKEIVDLRTWKGWNLLLADSSATDSNHNQSDHIDSNFLRIGGVSVSLLNAYPDSVITKWQHGSKTFLGNFRLTGSDGQVVLEWKLIFHIKWYPWDKLSSMFYEKEIGPLMEQSLMKLRTEMEDH